MISQFSCAYRILKGVSFPFSWTAVVIILTVLFCRPPFVFRLSSFDTARHELAFLSQSLSLSLSLSRPQGFSSVPLKADATDEEQSSDDEAPEEVSAAAATTLAGLRRKAELQARQAAVAPKRKRARTSSSKGTGSSKNASLEDRGAEDGEGGASNDGLELPSDLLLRVKSGGLQRMEADVLEAEEVDKQAAAAAEVAEGGRRRRRVKAEDVPRR